MMHINTVNRFYRNFLNSCCCMLCNKEKLAALLQGTSLCKDRPELGRKLAELIYHDLARANGLG